MHRQRGSIVKKGRSIYIVFRTPEKTQKWLGAFPNKASARSRLNEILVEIDRGTYLAPKPITFGEFASKYVDSRCSIRGSTASAYASMIRTHLVPFFGKLKLQEFSLENVQRFVAELVPKVSPKRYATVLRFCGECSLGAKA